MKTQKIVIVFGVILLIVLVGFLVYLFALSSAYTLNKPDKRPFFITTKPIVVKGILVPKGTKIIYKKQYFWEKQEQKKPLQEKNIIQIAFAEGATILWGGVPITSIVKFYNSEMNGFTVYADFSSLHKETRFSTLWQNCNDGLGITVEDNDDWSFNTKNILDVESCGVNYRRYYKDDENQQKHLDDLYHALMIIED
ncbi:hypothetical protein AB1A65_07145 [Muricauda sp. ANG21]|uniref:hypothetical protein n=1 Tax=Allomuricauda sp. ANG21 TaxID=3042468 RepID=UPI003451945C